ncbi:uncharacterized protein LOC108110037 [Drosophila eugracilis]|uniref:uncharacterized protein LOC108110037 n=1 Tax=Drosophila eugracilis TaxID=29029 RepID=UPI0007E73BC3|nr:uncharacterized protein LOC108110037 [Drosophila eugracilis]
MFIEESPSISSGSGSGSARTPGEAKPNEVYRTEPKTEPKPNPIRAEISLLRRQQPVGKWSNNIRGNFGTFGPMTRSGHLGIGHATPRELSKPPTHVHTLKLQATPGSIWQMKLVRISN